MGGNRHSCMAILLLVILTLQSSLYAYQMKTDASLNGERTFDVTKYGGRSDGTIDSTQAFLKAWEEACSFNGNSRVLVPQGTFLVGPVQFQGPCNGNSIVFKVQGEVKAPTLDKFDSDTWITFYNVDGLIVNGGGKFDGGGPLAWPYNQCSKNRNCKLLPTSLKFIHVNNTRVSGITSVNSKFFHMLVYGSNNVKFQFVKIFAPADSPNTDGIHIMSSTDIDVSHSTISTGDDCISIGPGTFNTKIYNVYCGPGHGISVGSLGKENNEEDVKDLRVENVTFVGTDNGVRIKTWPNSHVMISASNFSFEHITMNNVMNPIIIDQEYCPFDQCDLQSPSKVRISDINFNNITGSSASKVAVDLTCSKDFPCRNVRFKDIDLLYNGQDGPSVSSCSNVMSASFGKQNPAICA